MRCKKHFSDASSRIGVCSSCLTERLNFLIDSQSLNHNQIPPPVIFPRSVSPYISRRKSDASMDEQIRQRFFLTPQVIPIAIANETKKKEKKKSKFHAISKLFRSRSTKPAQSTLDLDPVCRGMSPNAKEDESPGLTRTSQARVKASPARSHIGICLSPLLRPSPSRHRKGVGPTEVAYSGEIRSTGNRSRKLADFGRFNHNR